MATAAQPRVTADEFLKMDLGPGLHELVRGEIVEMTPPGIPHGRICLRIAWLLESFGTQAGHGWAACNDSRVDIDAYTIRGADVLYYREDRWPRAEIETRPCPGPPDRTTPRSRHGQRAARTAARAG